MVNEIHVHFFSEAIKRVTHPPDKSVQIEERIKGAGFFFYSTNSPSPYF